MPLKQGEILRGCSELTFESAPLLHAQTEEEVEPRAKRLKHNYLLLISPDCDLEQDFKARVATDPEYAECFRSDGERSKFRDIGDRNYVTNAVLTPLWSSEEFKERADHKAYGQVHKGNNHPKWCMIGPMECDPAIDASGELSLVMDCGYIFTLPMNLLHESFVAAPDRFGWLPSPYREHYLQRFQFWQARIGVDDI